MGDVSDEVKAPIIVRSISGALKRLELAALSGNVYTDMAGDVQFLKALFADISEAN